VLIEFEYWNLVPGAHLTPSFHLYNEQGILVFGSGPTFEETWLGKPYPCGLFRDSCFIPGDLLNEGRYRIEFQIARDQTHLVFHEEALLAFEVQDSPEMRGGWHGDWAGAVRPILEWRTELLDDDLQE
jgi:lipopolysaccharide transport system ATP-binding protein